jgi:diguanylate cyclase
MASFWSVLQRRRRSWPSSSPPLSLLLVIYIPVCLSLILRGERCPVFHGARSDSLTGLLNQGAWRTELDKEFQIGTRGKSVATLALIDIDHFKAINDGHGHLIGDKVLKVVGRIGGDEFAVILRETDTRQAQVVLARVQKQLRQKLRTRSDLPTVSLSIGLAPFTAALTNVEDWIHASDTALYAAKRQGRDQIVSDLG